MNKLSKRLQAVADMVDSGSYLADVGSDHALLPIYLLQKGTVKWVQAIENKTEPFLRTKRNVEAAGLASHVHCSLSDGLTELSDEVDAVSICGIGGLLTCQILEKNPSRLGNVKTIILDPHRDLAAVRKRVSALGYRLIDEKMVYEQKIFYSVMKWRKGSADQPYGPDELAFGPILMEKRDETFLRYLGEQKEKISKILNRGLPKEKREYYLDLYRRIVKQL